MIADIFKQYDKDKSGKLSKKELTAVRRTCRHRPPCLASAESLANLIAFFAGARQVWSRA